MAMLQQGRPEAARSIQLESIAVFRDAGDKSGLNLVLGGSSNIDLALEDAGAGAGNYHMRYKEYRAWLEEAIHLARETGDVWSLALNLRGLGGIAMRQGDYAEARSLFQESLALQWEMGTRHETVATLVDLGQLAQLEGDLEGALELYERSLDLHRELADKRGMINSMAAIGGVALRRSDIPRAVEVLTTALETARELGSPRYSLVALDAIGWLLVGLRQHARAAMLLSAVESLYKKHPFLRLIIARMEHNYYLECARAQLDPVTWQEAWAAGETMSIEEALQFASANLKADNE
jgi:tetratricopeptide (TPR) repeat protein